MKFWNQCRASLVEARRLGMTSIEDMDGSSAATKRQLLRVYQELAKQGKLTARISLALAAGRLGTATATIRFRVRLRQRLIRIGGIERLRRWISGIETPPKCTNSTSTKRDPRAFSSRLWTKLRQHAPAADKVGLNVAVHAIGDQANAEILNIFTDVALAHNGPAQGRWFRIEHAQHLRPDDNPRFREAGSHPFHAALPRH